MKRRIALSTSIVLLAGTGAALAASSGVNRVVLAKGTLDENLKLEVDGPVEVSHRITTWEPGGTTGWVSYPGPLVSTVKAGTLTFQSPSQDDCAELTRGTGRSRVIPAGTVFRTTNNGSDAAEVHLVAFLPPGSKGAKEEPKPDSCSE